MSSAARPHAREEHPLAPLDPFAYDVEMPVAVKLPPEAERAALRGERVMIELPGGRLAAIVPVEDLRELEALEAVEDEADLQAYRDAKAKWESEGRPTVTLDELTRETDG